MTKDHSSPHPLCAYLVLVFLLGWGAWALAWTAGAGPRAELTSWAPFLPGMAAPALAAWLADRSSLRGSLRIRRRCAPLCLLAGLLPLVLAVLVVLAVYALNLSLPDYALGRGYVLLAGSPVPPWLRFGHVLLAAALAGPLLAPLALGQELGWRGLLQSRLYPRGRWVAAAVTGIAWALWLSPLAFRSGASIVEGALLVTACVLLSLLNGWLHRITGTVWAPALALASVLSPGALLLAVLFGGGPNSLLIGALALLLLGVTAVFLHVVEEDSRGKAPVRTER